MLVDFTIRALKLTTTNPTHKLLSTVAAAVVRVRKMSNESRRLPESGARTDQGKNVLHGNKNP